MPMALGTRRATASARISDWRGTDPGDSRLAGSRTMPTAASWPSSSRRRGAGPAAGGGFPRWGVDAERAPGGAGGIEEAVQGASHGRPGVGGQVPRVGAPHVVRVARAGTERDDVGAQVGDEADQPDRLRGLGGAEPAVGMDEVEGGRDAGDGHAGAVEGAADGGDHSMSRTAASPSRPAGSGWPPVRMVRANASTWRS